MTKTELVAVARARLAGSSAQQYEEMEETTLHRELESLVRACFVAASFGCSPNSENPAPKLLAHREKQGGYRGCGEDHHGTFKFQ